MRERVANYVIMADLVAKNRREGRWLVTIKSSSLKIEMPSYSSVHKVGLPWVLEGGGEVQEIRWVANLNVSMGVRLHPYTGPYRVWG